MKRSQKTPQPAPTEPAAVERLTMTVPEVAAALGICRNHAYWMINTRKIPAKRLGRRFIIPRSALEQWLADRNG